LPVAFHINIYCACLFAINRTFCTSFYCVWEV
jgi:hypothetical protein